MIMVMMDGVHDGLGLGICFDTLDEMIDSGVAPART